MSKACKELYDLTFSTVNTTIIMHHGQARFIHGGNPGVVLNHDGTLYGTLLENGIIATSEHVWLFSLQGKARMLNQDIDLPHRIQKCDICYEAYKERSKYTKRKMLNSMHSDILSKETVHLCPPGDYDLTPCCGIPIMSLPVTDRMTLDKNLVTCNLELDFNNQPYPFPHYHTCDRCGNRWQPEECYLRGCEAYEHACLECQTQL